MVAPMRQVERQLSVAPAHAWPDFACTLHIHNYLTTKGQFGRHNGIIAKTDHVGGVVPAEVLAVDVRYASIIGEHEGKLAPVLILRCSLRPRH